MQVDVDRGDEESISSAGRMEELYRCKYVGSYSVVIPLLDSEAYIQSPSVRVLYCAVLMEEGGESSDVGSSVRMLEAAVPSSHLTFTH